MIDINCKTEGCDGFVTCEDEDVTKVTCSYCCATMGVCNGQFRTIKKRWCYGFNIRAW